jgi:transcriptional regulator GlxA family with amidase domain
MLSSDTRLHDRDDKAPTHVGFLLIPDFALLPYASAIEPLRAANRLSGRPLYRWSHVSVDGGTASASNGVAIATDACVGAELRLDYLFVCAGGNPALFQHQPTFAWLRQLARRGVRIGGVSGGPYLLARANVLSGYRFTIHWEHAPALLEEYPGLDLRRSLYEIDRDRLTCSGGTAPLDMMHAIIAREHGSPLALAVSEWFLQTHVREGAGPQRMPLRERLGIAHAPLLRVIGRMEQTIENPESRAELARLANVSLRQLERLFRQHLGCSLGEHYLGLRLNRARDLLRQTSLSILEIALACGFASASHFSRSYRRCFGHPPRAERLRQHPPLDARRQESVVLDQMNRPIRRKSRVSDETGDRDR